MNWQTIDWETFLLEALITAALAFLIAFSGWLAAHYLTGKRERKNHRRQQQTACIIQAWNTIHEIFALAAFQKGNIQPRQITKMFAPVVARIQLLGTDEQIELIREVISETQKAARAKEQGQDTDVDINVGPLLKKLRDDLRKNLGIPAASTTILTLQPGKHAPPSAQRRRP